MHRIFLYFWNIDFTPFTISRPIFLSTPCLVVGMPVAEAILRLNTSSPRALFGENDVPGNPNIFISSIQFLQVFYT